MVYYLGTRVDIVDKKLLDQRNKNRLWKYGYDPELDVVIVSKDGTLGDIYNINGLNIGLPKQPPKTAMVNYGTYTKGQRWQREEMPEGLRESNIERETSRFVGNKEEIKEQKERYIAKILSEHEDYIDEQYRKRDEGMWILLNGNPVWLTGLYWYFIQWIRIEEEYPNLRIIQNELMIFWEACKADNRSFGMQYVKNRRIGASSLAVAELLESGTIFEDKLLGLISKTGEDASDIFQRIVTAFKRLPIFFKPETDGTNSPKKTLSFREQTRKRKSGEFISADEGNNTDITWYTTSKNAMDGRRIFRSLLDECFAQGTKILMDDLTFKPIEDIKVGEYVTVEGGKKMRVANTCQGIDEMFLIKQPYSNDYVVNSKHRLYLEQRCKVKGIHDDGIKIMTPLEFLNLGKYKKRTTFGLRSKGIEKEEQPVLIDPYIFGMWLGDGDSECSRFAVNTKDVENVDSIKTFCKENNFNYSIKKTTSKNCIRISIIRPDEDKDKNARWFQNKFVQNLKEYDVLKNKHIPEKYLNNSIKVRLNLLAGLLDTDGYLAFKNNSYSYEIALADENLSNQILFLSRSLGFKANLKHKKTNLGTAAYKVLISGNISEIPCRIKRKIVPAEYTREYNHYINKISVESIGKGKYYGITLEADNDDDRRLILEDFTISMNCGKFPKEVPFDKYWSVVRTSHVKGRVIFGKAMVVSTVNAMDDGGREFKNVWDASDMTVRDGNGRTQSGLYRIFIPAKYCLEGYFDEYGFSIVDDPQEPVVADDGTKIDTGAVTFLKNALEALKNNPSDYNEQLRQFPDSERDAFRDEAGNCDFNLVHILEQLEHNDYELEDGEYGNNEVERGNFQWKDGIPDTEVVWKPDRENGRFWIANSCHPPEEYRNKKVKRVLHGVEAWAPINDYIGCLGVDPYNRSKTVDNRGSKGSIHGSTSFNTGPFPNDAFFLEYIDRPLKVEFFFEDVIMAMVYFSMPFLGELSNEQFFKTIKDRGYRHFSLNNPFKAWKDLSPTEKEFGGMPAQDAKIGDQQFYAIESYVQDHIGVARVDTFRTKGEMGWMPFSRTLNQWKDVDTTKRTKYDAFISSSLSRLGNQRRAKPTEEKKDPIKIPFKLYNNKGAVSVAMTT